MALPRFPPRRVRPMAACAAATLAVLAPEALPATFSVTNCNDGAPAPAGSLRWAVQSIDPMSAGDIIDLTTLSCSTITLTAGAITDKGRPLTMNGPTDHTLTIDGNHAGRVLVHNGSSTVPMTINDLTIANGSYALGLYGGACIYSYGKLVLSHTTVIGCKLTSTGSKGGGIYAHGNLELRQSTLSGNRIDAVTGSSTGGAGAFVRGNLYVTQSTVSNNYSLSYAAGIRVLGTVDIRYSTFSGNYAHRDSALLADGSSTAIIFDSTFNRNYAGEKCAAISAQNVGLYNSTVTANHQFSEGNGCGAITGGTLFAYSSIIADNHYTGGSDVYTQNPIVGDHNLILTAKGSLPADTITQEPLLGALADNGGPTFTQALLPGSPAINAGSNASLKLLFDQRGFARVVGASADIGAFESDVIFTNGFD